MPDVVIVFCCILDVFRCGCAIELPRPAPVPPPFCAIAYMPSDKHTTVIAVVLLMFPGFILPLEVEMLLPDQLVLKLKPVPTDKNVQKYRRAPALSIQERNELHSIRVSDLL